MSELGMKVSVSVIAIGGGAEHEMDMADGATIADVLAALALPKAESYATLLNGQSVSAADRRAHPMNDGDTLTVFPPIEGG